MKRKFLAWLLTIAMVFNMALPYAAFADELPVDTGTSYSADNNDANDNNDATDVEGEPTVGEPSADVEQPAAGEPSDEEASDEEPVQDEQPAEANTANTEYPGEEASPANLGTAAPQSVAGDVMPADEPATSGSCGATDADNVTWSYDADTTTLTISGTGAMKTLSSYRQQPWGSYRTAITKLIVESGITSIGRNSLRECTNLSEISIADTVTSIGEYAFTNCKKITKIDLPENLQQIDASAFSKCQGLTEITIPATVTVMGQKPFENCTGITKATLGKIAPADMFKGCTALQEVKILDGVTSFGTTTFNGCTGLSTIEVPASLTDWGTDPFKGVNISNLTFTGAGADNFAWDGDVLYNNDKTVMIAAKNVTGEFSVLDKVTAIAANCFKDCTGLTAVKFGENSKLATIGDSAFDGCTGLTSFSFPKGELTLGAFVFQGTSIENLVIPANVKEFGEMGNMPNLKTVKIYAPVTSLPARAFNESTKLETIYIPANVTMIGWYTLPVTSTGSLKYIYYGGTKAQFESGTLWSKQKNDIINNGISVIYNYVEPTTEDGKLQVVAQPADIACDNVAAQATDITMQLKYPDGVTAAAGDKIWVDWYYTTQETPNGLRLCGR